MSVVETAIVVLLVVGVSFQFDFPLQSNQSRIVAGYSVTKPVPYQVSLQLKKKPGIGLPSLLDEPGEWAHTCGGSILDTLHILTAAHCVTDGNPEKLSILAGTLKRNHGGTRHLIEWIRIHPKYQELVTSDIAIIKVKSPLQFSSTIGPIELEPARINGGVPVILTGWGYTRPIRVGRLPEQLRAINYTTLTNDDCRKRGFDVSDTEICTYKSFLRGACAGDSGGPLVNKQTKQVGIVSYGSLVCATGRPDAFTRISNFISWIKEQMKD